MIDSATLNRWLTILDRTVRPSADEDDYLEMCDLRREIYDAWRDAAHREVMAEAAEVGK